jgi:hypothetical protein
MCEQGGCYFQQEIAKNNKVFNHAETVNMSTKREHFTRHGLHVNGSGKDWITSPLATKIIQIFTTCKPKPPILLTWMAETNEKGRKERSVEEGRNSPSQESGLNKKLTGNYNQCKVTSASDSVTSTGGKESESESEVGELKHRASKRTKKNAGSKYGALLWT